MGWVIFCHSYIGYLFYHPIEQKVFVSRHAIFMEKKFIQEESNERIIKLSEVQDEQTQVPQLEVPID